MPKQEAKLNAKYPEGETLEEEKTSSQTHFSSPLKAPVEVKEARDMANIEEN